MMMHFKLTAWLGNMINKLSFSEFHRSFIQAGRGETFSPMGLVVMYEYLQPLARELITRNICYAYTEYEDMHDFRATYGYEYNTWVDIEEVTILIPVDDERFIIKDF